jgi:hypothetical protein
MGSRLIRSEVSERATISIEFREHREHHTLGQPFQLRVVRSGVVIGHVRRNAGGVFQYYRGEFNELTYEFQDPDLDKLKERIEQTEGHQP